MAELPPNPAAQMFGPALLKSNEVTEWPYRIVMNADETRAMARAAELERQWMMSRKVLFWLSWITIMTLVSAVASIAAAPRSLLISGVLVIALLVGLVAILVAIFVNTSRRRAFRDAAKFPVVHVPLTRLRRGEKLAGFRVTIADRETLLLSRSLSGVIVLASKWAAAALIAVSIGALAYGISQLGIGGFVAAIRMQFVVLNALLLFALLVWSLTSTPIRWVVARTGPKEPCYLGIVSASLRRGIHTVGIRLDPVTVASFETDGWWLYVTSAEHTRLQLMPIPSGELGRWHAARIVAAIQSIADPGMSEPVVLVTDDAGIVPVAAWPVVDQIIEVP